MGEVSVSGRSACIDRVPLRASGGGLAYHARTMYVVVIGVLSLVLAFSAPPLRWITGPSAAIASAVAATLVPVVAAWIVGRRALRLLDRNPADPGIGQFAFGRGMLIVRALLGLAHAGLLATTDWMTLCLHTPIVGRWPAVGGLLAAVPLLVSILLVWIVVYPVERAIREIALETYLFRGRPVRPVWSLAQYLVFNLRHQVLFILVPLLMILAARDIIVAYERPLRAWSGQKMFPDLLLGVCAGAVAVVTPALLRRIWVTQPLPDGPLRDRLMHLCRRLKMRCREVLIWHSGGMIVNAAVMGVVAPLRYFLITDGMLEQMQDVRIEAVFGHEAGHVKRHHILFFLLFAFISGCAITSVSQRCHGLDKTTYQAVILITSAALVFKWGVLFGWVSRRFERQADVFGVRTLALAGIPCLMDCALHGEANNREASPKPDDRRGDPLCMTAANIFAQTLHEVAALNGIPVEARSWRHGSIASRGRALVQLARDPLATARFERRLFYVKLAILLAALGAGAVAATDVGLWKLLGL